MRDPVNHLTATEVSARASFLEATRATTGVRRASGNADSSEENIFPSDPGQVCNPTYPSGSLPYKRNEEQSRGDESENHVVLLLLLVLLASPLSQIDFVFPASVM